MSVYRGEPYEYSSARPPHPHTKGDHEKWFCPCGRYTTVSTKPDIVSPGLVMQSVQRLSYLPKGSFAIDPSEGRVRA